MRRKCNKRIDGSARREAPRRTREQKERKELPEGALLVSDFVMPDEERLLVAEIDSREWSHVHGVS